MFVALLALVVALGGASYAVTQLPKNSVGTPQLKANAVTSPKVKDGSLKATDFGAGQLPAGPQGEQGPPGATGPAGAPGSAAFAMVTGRGAMSGSNRSFSLDGTRTGTAAWPATSDGCLRFLARIDDIEATVAPEVKPLYGHFAVFRRADNSFHGHLPYEGERRVLQIAWLTSEEEKLRKTQRGKLSRFFTQLFGKLDARWGAGRDKSAAHRD